MGQVLSLQSKDAIHPSYRVVMVDLQAARIVIRPLGNFPLMYRPKTVPLLCDDRSMIDYSCALPNDCVDEAVQLGRSQRIRLAAYSM